MTTEQRTFYFGPGRKWLPVSSTFAAVSLVIFAAVLGASPDPLTTTPSSALVAAALLALSILLDFFVVRALRPDSLLANELALCEGVKGGLVLAYLVFEKGGAEGADFRIAAGVISGASLLVALIVTAAMIYAAAEMIPRPEHARKLPQLVIRGSLEELLTDKVLALTCLVIAFLHVTYFLSFAIAFSDRFAGPHLFSTRIAETQMAAPEPEKAPVVLSGPPSCGSGDSDRVRKFFFVESAATSACTLELCAAADADESLRRSVCEGGVAARVAAFEKVAVQLCGNPANLLQFRAATWNLRELYELRAEFRRRASDPNGGSYLVEIRGHANDTAVKDDPTVAYGSNYEISKQRADQIALILSSAFREATHDSEPPSVRWLAYGVSNETSFLDPLTAADWKDAAPLEPKLSVEVKILKVAESLEDLRLRSTYAQVVASRSVPRVLDLTDYIYFTVYTITTTGYGDIIPVTAYAKFLVTLANLIEMLFIVLLVNVIANTRLEQGGSPPGGEAP